MDFKAFAYQGAGTLVGILVASGEPLETIRAELNATLDRLAQVGELEQLHAIGARLTPALMEIMDDVSALARVASELVVVPPTPPYVVTSPPAAAAVPAVVSMHVCDQTCGHLPPPPPPVVVPPPPPPPFVHGPVCDAECGHLPPAPAPPAPTPVVVSAPTPPPAAAAVPVKTCGACGAVLNPPFELGYCRACGASTKETT
jgi:hypothetical protein